jgi:hypothetical protein
VFIEPLTTIWDTDRSLQPPLFLLSGVRGIHRIMKVIPYAPIESKPSLIRLQLIRMSVNPDQNIKNEKF